MIEEKEKKEETKKEVFVPTADVPNLVDIVASNLGTPVFLTCKDHILKPYSKIKDGKVTYVPPPKNSMPWALPNVERVVHHYYNDTDELLFNDIEKLLRSNTELPDDRLFTFLPAWEMHSHLIEKAAYSPIIIFFGRHSCGKTRTAKILTWMARRGVISETLREPDIIRKSHLFGCVYLFDIMDIWKKAERMNAVDILLGRFERGHTIARVLWPDRGPFLDTFHYSCFGATLVTTNEPVGHILDSRGITIVMQEAKKPFENDICEADFLEIRARLIAFRARWLTKDLPEVPKPAKYRLGDILRPIAQIITAVCPDRMSALTSIIEKFEEDRVNTLADSPEGKLIRILLGLEIEAEAGVIATKKVMESFNEDVPSHYHMGVVSVGKKLSSLGFLNSKTPNGERGFLLNPELLQKLAKQYGALSSRPKPDGADRTDGAENSGAGEPETLDDILTK